MTPTSARPGRDRRRRRARRRVDRVRARARGRARARARPRALPARQAVRGVSEPAGVAHPERDGRARGGGARGRGASHRHGGARAERRDAARRLRGRSTAFAPFATAGSRCGASCSIPSCSTARGRAGAEVREGARVADVVRDARGRVTGVRVLGAIGRARDAARAARRRRGRAALGRRAPARARARVALAAPARARRALRGVRRRCRSGARCTSSATSATSASPTWTAG